MTRYRLYGGPRDGQVRDLAGNRRTLAIAFSRDIDWSEIFSDTSPESLVGIARGNYSLWGDRGVGVWEAQTVGVKCCDLAFPNLAEGIERGVKGLLAYGGVLETLRIEIEPELLTHEGFVARITVYAPGEWHAPTEEPSRG
jgi:hypothetical protein